MCTIKMSREKIIITSPGPILPGTISTAHSKCGKPTCRCRQDPKYLHGPYYRWIGWINGKPTTKNISEETAQECQRRIENYKELQKKSRRPLPTRSTRRLGRKRRKNDRFNSESYTTQSRTLKVRNVVCCTGNLS
jgi:hypothetical protein